MHPPTEKYQSSADMIAARTCGDSLANNLDNACFGVVFALLAQRFALLLISAGDMPYNALTTSFENVNLPLSSSFGSKSPYAASKSFSYLPRSMLTRSMAVL